MQAQSWRFIDKAAWGRGEWDEEPDKAQWEDAATGLPCMVRRNEWTGTWCGYVGVTSGHPYHREPYQRLNQQIHLQVHGGLTYSAECTGTPELGVCHLPDQGEDDNVWWIGFDCAHSADFSPGNEFMRQFAFPGSKYRNLTYVIEQCRKLALALKRVETLCSKGVE